MNSNTKILIHNIQRYNEQSYYYLRVAMVYLCVGAALAVKLEALGAMVIVVLTGFILVLSYPGKGYTWDESTDIIILASYVEKLRIRRIRQIRWILVLGTIVALAVELGVHGIIIGQS